MLRYIGFSYVNTVAQPLSKQTFHKVKNPSRVLGESLIVNFQKNIGTEIIPAYVSTNGEYYSKCGGACGFKGGRGHYRRNTQRCSARAF